MPTTPKEYAATLLHRYDAMRKEMRALERELNKAAVAYGKTIGCGYFNKDHLRIRLSYEAGDKV